MPQISYSPSAIPGIARENAFHVLDETGVNYGNAVVAEYINHAILQERPLNYYISIHALSEFAFDQLIGAALARSMELRRRNPSLKARIYAPCKPHDTQLLRSLEEFGFRNDDAIIRMRRILQDTDKMPNPPVGCYIAPVLLEQESDMDALLSRVNAYSVVARGRNWLLRLQQEQLFAVFGVWQDARLLGELLLSAYGAEGRVEMVYTRPEYRGRGIATSLIAYAGLILRKSDIRNLTAEVWRRNASTMSLFGTLRFESVAPTILYPGIDL